MKSIFEEKVDNAIVFLEKNYQRLDLLILDVMMPPGDHFAALNTQYGLRTGILLYEKIREKYPELPILVFTNISDETLNEIEDSKSQFLHKEDYLPLQFASQVKSFLGK